MRPVVDMVTFLCFVESTALRTYSTLDWFVLPGFCAAGCQPWRCQACERGAAVNAFHTSATAGHLTTYHTHIHLYTPPPPPPHGTVWASAQYASRSSVGH